MLTAQINTIIERILLIAPLRHCEARGTSDAAIQKMCRRILDCRVALRCNTPRNDARLENSSRFSLFTSHFSRRKAFTLSEILITLGIIGVISAITIPTLMNNIQDAQYKTAYKKAYSAISQALAQANADNLLVPTAGGTLGSRPTDADKNFLQIMSKFKTVKQCLDWNNKLCWENTGERYSANHPDIYELAFIDSSGMAWSQYYWEDSVMFVDTNGFKTPNQWGKDRFAFFLYDENNSDSSGIPIKVVPYKDNSYMCSSTNTLPNKCVKDQNYYGTSWLYQE